MIYWKNKAITNSSNFEIILKFFFVTRSSKHDWVKFWPSFSQCESEMFNALEIIAGIYDMSSESLCLLGKVGGNS